MRQASQSFQYLTKISILEAIVGQNYGVDQVFVALESRSQTLTDGSADFVVEKRKDLATDAVEDWQR